MQVKSLTLGKALAPQSGRLPTIHDEDLRKRRVGIATEGRATRALLRWAVCHLLQPSDQVHVLHVLPKSDRSNSGTVTQGQAGALYSHLQVYNDRHSSEDMLLLQSATELSLFIITNSGASTMCLLLCADSALAHHASFKQPLERASSPPEELARDAATDGADELAEFHVVSTVALRVCCTSAVISSCVVVKLGSRC